MSARSRQAPSCLARPRDIFWPERKNSSGVPLMETTARAALLQQMEQALTPGYDVGPIVDGQETVGGPNATNVACPHDWRERIGTVRVATPAQVEAAIASATAAAHSWDKLGAPARARMLDYAADTVERDRARLMAVLVREGGKTLPAALAEVREAADLLRYYAAEARRMMSGPLLLKGTTGETNTLELRPRGPFACIAPWNFPLAIFMGQIAAALAAGNPVLAKPAEETPITAYLAVKLFHEAGVPKNVLHLLPGGGSVGAALVKSPRVKGVAFTGGNDTAWAIQKALAERRGEIIPFIAETGGINAMIADSSALTEQVVRDVVRSAYDSAGQRCSAARVLFVQEDVANRTIRMLTGAIEALDIGDPFDYATDIGPVINEAAQDSLEAHKVRMQAEGRELIDLRLPETCRTGTYVTPAAYEIERMGILDKRGLRAHPARRALRPRPHRQGRGRRQRIGLRPHHRGAQPHQRGGGLRRRARPRRQPLRQPQSDRRRPGRTAVRRRGPVGHRAQGRRPELCRPLCHRARPHDRHYGHRR